MTKPRKNPVNWLDFFVPFFNGIGCVVDSQR